MYPHPRLYLVNLARLWTSNRTSVPCTGEHSVRSSSRKFEWIRWQTFWSSPTNRSSKDAGWIKDSHSLKGMIKLSAVDDSLGGIANLYDGDGRFICQSQDLWVVVPISEWSVKDSLAMAEKNRMNEMSSAKVRKRTAGNWYGSVHSCRPLSYKVQQSNPFAILFSWSFSMYHRSLSILP